MWACKAYYLWETKVFKFVYMVNDMKKALRNILKNKAVAIFIIVVLVVLFTLFVMKMFDNIDGKMGTKVKLETNHGDIVIQLYGDMPVTAGNFQKLVEAGTYDGVIFHRIIPNFMIQGGDPTGTGMGDSKIANIKDEFVAGHSNVRGTLSMANAGPNTGSSQFFINLVDNSFLDYDKQPLSSKHPVFGEVIEGMDTVDKIAAVETGAQDRPVEEVKILKATIL
jgi:peptidylprolyl isomerase